MSRTDRWAAIVEPAAGAVVGAEAMTVVPSVPVGGRCRLCGEPGLRSVLDLGAMPPCQRFLRAEQLDESELTHPLHLRWCPQCLLLQIPAVLDARDNFSEYAYYSSYSASWVAHAERFVASAVPDLGADPFIVEVASNDGYLLQHVVARGIRCLGVEPSHNVSKAARAAGVPTRTAFLDESLAHEIVAEHGPADLVVANNVWAHIPDITGFTTALAVLAGSTGRVSIEVHHALHLVEQAQFDTIYHEHFQYWTVLAAERALTRSGLRLIDVEELPSHGGSIRLWAAPLATAPRVSDSVRALQDRERQAGLDQLEGYLGLPGEAARIRRDLVRFLLDAQQAGRRVVGYGAAGKGQTLLNYCGIRPDLLDWIADQNPYKHHRYSPGMRIEVVPPDQIERERPDLVLVLPWNLRTEITAQLAHIAAWGGQLVFAQPRLEVVDPGTGEVVVPGESLPTGTAGAAPGTTAVPR